MAKKGKRLEGRKVNFEVNGERRSIGMYKDKDDFVFVFRSGGKEVPLKLSPEAVNAMLTLILQDKNVV